MTIWESIIDHTLKHYSKDIFKDPTSNNPTIKESLRNRIISDVKKISNIVDVVDVFIKGSILTKKYGKLSDIDIHVHIKDSDLDDDTKDKLLDLWDELDNTYLDDIPYPLQYFIAPNKYNFKNTEAAYDILNNEWIKREPLKDINIDDYIDDFEYYIKQFSDFTEDLRQNMIDYEILKDIPSDQLENLDQLMSDKLDDIEKSLSKLDSVYSDLRDYRNNSFKDEMTPSEIKKYGIKTKLPGNVVFKLIERYHYIDMVKRIRRIIGDIEDIDNSDYEKLNATLKTNLIKEDLSFRDIINESIGIKHIKRRGDMQHKPDHRHQRLSAGKENTRFRKSLNILPDYMRKKGKKTEHILDTAKKFSKEIRVKIGSPKAKYYAEKYRISDPTGVKIVGSNQNSSGIKLIFEKDDQDNESNLNIYLIGDIFIPIMDKSFYNIRLRAETEVKALKRFIISALPAELKGRYIDQLKSILADGCYTIKKL